MANKIQIKRGVKNQLPTLSNGELGLCYDTRELYVGTNANNLKLIGENDIINNVTSGGTTKVLSAEQGKGLKQQIDNLKTRYDNFIGKALFLSEYPNHNDYSTLINDFCNTYEDVLIVCENRKEYRFNTPLNFKGRVLIEGNDSLWRYMGTSQTFIKFNQAPWQTEGSVIKDIKFWCNEKSVGAYQEKYCFFIEGYQISLKFHNLCVYNFGYPWFMKDTDVNSTSNAYHTFGHSITECNVWGFICAINSRGNAEQVLVEHCWFDDGKRTSGSQNAAIRVEDATSFWIRNCIIQNADIGVLFRGVVNGEISGCHFENMISASIWMYPASAYDNRNNLIINNFIVGHKSGIYFYVPSSAYTKNIHTTIIGNYFAFLGEGATECIKKANATSESHTLMINNSKLNADWNWYGSSMTTLKEFQ